MATLQFSGRVAGTGLLEIGGALNPTVIPPALDIKAKATDIELPGLTRPRVQETVKPTVYVDDEHVHRAEAMRGRHPDVIRHIVGRLPRMARPVAQPVAPGSRGCCRSRRRHWR